MNKAVKLVAVWAAFLFGATFAGNVTVHADSSRYDMVDVSNHNGQMTTPEFIDMRDAYGVKAVTTKISEERVQPIMTGLRLETFVMRKKLACTSTGITICMQQR